jgi:hypothetical protein
MHASSVHQLLHLTTRSYPHELNIAIYLIATAGLLCEGGEIHAH